MRRTMLAAVLAIVATGVAARMLDLGVPADAVTATRVRADNFQNFGEKTLVDLRLTGRYERASLQLFGNNVFDNDRPVAGVRFFASTNYSVSSPLVQGADRREFGATLGYRF